MYGVCFGAGGDKVQIEFRPPRASLRFIVSFAYFLKQRLRFIVIKFSVLKRRIFIFFILSIYYSNWFNWEQRRGEIRLEEIDASICFLKKLLNIIDALSFFYDFWWLRHQSRFCKLSGTRKKKKAWKGKFSLLGIFSLAMSRNSKISECVASPLDFPKSLSGQSF